MGADARLFVFDYEFYRGSVVPAFLRLMQDGAAEDWLLELYRAYVDELGSHECFGRNSTGFTSIDLMNYCTYLDSELAVTRVFAAPQSSYDGRWETRACRCLVCPVRERCPFHYVESEQLPVVVDDWLRWFELAVVRRCLGAGQFLGRSIDCFSYWDTLDQLGVAPAHPIRLLLERLGRRGFLVGHRGSYGTEGIHGWLRPDEARALADHLFTLNLPDYECSFVAMQKFRTVRNVLEGRVVGVEFQWPVYEHPHVSFEELSLSYVRTVCNLAVREGKGVLWGNDVA